jgi:hypothetical protein
MKQTRNQKQCYTVGVWRSKSRKTITSDAESGPWGSPEFSERRGYAGVGQGNEWTMFVIHKTICQAATSQQLADSGLTLVDLTER